MDRKPSPKTSVQDHAGTRVLNLLNTWSRALSASLSCFPYGLWYTHKYIIKQIQSILDLGNISHGVMGLEQAIEQIGGRSVVHVKRKKQRHGANIKPKMYFLLTFFSQSCQILMIRDEQVLMPPFYQLINQEERLLILTDVKDEIFSKHASHRWQVLQQPKVFLEAVEVSENWPGY